MPRNRGLRKQEVRFTRDKEIRDRRIEGRTVDTNCGMIAKSSEKGHGTLRQQGCQYLEFGHRALWNSSLLSKATKFVVWLSEAIRVSYDRQK